MDLPVVALVGLERYSPGVADPIGLRADGWAVPVGVESFGWWQPSPDDATDTSGRRAVARDVDLLVPAATSCGDRDRWTVDGHTYLQTGEAQDYNHGPFAQAVPLVVYLRRVEG